MKKYLPIIFFPIVIITLAGMIYLQAGERRTLLDAEQAKANGDPARAGKILASGAVQYPSLWEQAAAYAFQAGDFQVALDYLYNAQTSKRLTERGYLLLGDVYQQLGKPEEAIRAWQTAVELGAPALEVHLRNLEAHRALQDYSAAIEDLRAILKLSPDNAQARYQLGLILATREPETALIFLLQAVELDDSLSEAVSSLEANLVPAQSDDPAFSLLNAGRGLAYLGEWALAAEAFSHAVGINPGYAEAWAFWGEAKEQSGQNGLAELDTALNLNPQSITANLLYALYQKRHGNFDLALAYLQVAENLEPDNPAIQAEIGNTLNAQGDFNAALEYFKRATALSPRDPTYLILLAQFTFQNNTLIEEIGLPAANEALRINETDPILLDLVGFGHYLLGDLDTAESFFQQAAGLSPDNPQYWFHLGLVSLARGENLPAREYLDRAINLDTASPVAEEAKRVLARYFP